MDEASPLHALCCLMSESKHAGPDWSAASSLFHHGRVESADPEEKREPCERHPNTPIDGRKSEVLDIERPNRDGLNVHALTAEHMHAQPTVMGQRYDPTQSM